LNLIDANPSNVYKNNDLDPLMKTDATSGINGTSDMNLAYQALRSRDAPQHSSKELKVDNAAISDTLETTDREGNGKSEFQSTEHNAPSQPTHETGSHLDITG
jgi:hypothetical protein